MPDPDMRECRSSVEPDNALDRYALNSLANTLACSLPRIDLLLNGFIISVNKRACVSICNAHYGVNAIISNK